MSTMANGPTPAPGGAGLGQVIAVRGGVVDVRFAPPLPPRRQALRARAGGADEAEIVLEVESHLAADRVRCFALTPTRGLARGTPVIDTGGGLEVPVGKALLGRMLNLFGEPIDGLGPLPEGPVGYPLRAAPPAAHARGRVGERPRSTPSPTSRASVSPRTACLVAL